MASLSIRDVYKTYPNGVPVLKGVDIEIEDGQFLILVGGSGCGKSTLLNMIAGLETVTRGEIRIDGKVVNELSPKDRDIAMVFQSYALYPHMTLYDNMAFGLKLAGAKKPEIDQAVRHAAKILHIDHLLDRKPKQLSGGQRQRVAIGRAITRKPKVFLFDEPLSNLDAALRVKMRLEFARLHGELKTTMIYVTHDQVEAMTLADKIVVLSEGRVQQVGTPNTLYHAPANQFVAGFIGSPKMNFLRGIVDSVAADGVRVRFASGEAQRVLVDAAGLQRGAAVTVGIRPEHLTVGTDAAAVALGVAVTTMAVESLGDAAYLYAESPVAPDGLIARIPPLDTYRTGERLHVFAEPEHCHLFDDKGQAFRRVRPHARAA